MNYAIFDSNANLVEGFATKKDAQQALKKIVHEEPEAASELAILTFNDGGSPVGKAILGTSFLPLRQAA